MKNVSMRMPEPGPLGETLFEANVRAIVAALLLKRPGGGWVESVLTLALHFLFFRCILAGLTCWMREERWPAMRFTCFATKVSP